MIATLEEAIAEADARRQADVSHCAELSVELERTADLLEKARHEVEGYDAKVGRRTYWRVRRLIGLRPRDRVLPLSEWYARRSVRHGSVIF